MIVRKPLNTRSTRGITYSINSTRNGLSPALVQSISRSKITASIRARRPRCFNNRYISTTREATTDVRSIVARLKNIAWGTAIGSFLVFGYFYVTDTRAGIHRWIVAPSLRLIYDDAEDAHLAGINSLKKLFELGLHPRERGNPDGAGDLEIEVTPFLDSQFLLNVNVS